MTDSAKTIRRPRNRCRVVITYEVEIPETELITAPAWRRHACDYFRDLAQGRNALALIQLIRKRRSITIVSESVEIAP